MKIKRDTLWVEFAPFATDARMAQLREKITDCAVFDFLGLSIADFSELFEGKYPDEIKKQIEKKNVTIYEVVSIVNAIEAFLNEFKNIMSSFEIQMDADEMKAASFMPEFTPIENMLIFTQKYFGLPNFGEAEKISLLEFVLAKKADYSNAIYQRKISQIQLKKYK